MDYKKIYEDGIVEGKRRALEAIESVDLQTPVQHHMSDTTYEDKDPRSVLEDCKQAIRNISVVS